MSTLTIEHVAQPYPAADLNTFKPGDVVQGAETGRLYLVVESLSGRGNATVRLCGRAIVEHAAGGYRRVKSAVLTVETGPA